MKKLWRILVLAFILVYAFTVSVAAFPSVGVVSANTAGKVIVRNAPSDDAGIVKTVRVGDKITVEAQVGEWYKISTASISGYIQMEFVILSEEEKVEQAVENTQIVKKEGQFPKWGYVSTASAPLRLRAKPSITSEVLTLMPKNSDVTVLSGEYVREEAKGQVYCWFNVQYGTMSGYACLNESSSGYDYITIEGTTTVTEVQDKTTTGWIRTNGANLYVRNSPKYGNNRIGSVANGSEVAVTGNAQNGFYRIAGTLTSGTHTTGYVCADYVTFETPNNIGGGSIIAGGPVALNVMSYKQYNYPNDRVGQSQKSIKSVGCFVTSMAMVHNYHTGKMYTPVTIQNLLSFTGACFYHSSVTNLGYTMEKRIGNANSLKTAYNALQQGRPVIVCVSSSSGSTHYVVITGYDGNPTNLTASGFLINDPGSSTNTRLSQAMAKKPTITQVIY